MRKTVSSLIEKTHENISEKKTIVQCDQASTEKPIAGDDGTKDFKDPQAFYTQQLSKPSTCEFVS